jgi:hypothetical protein
MHSLWNHGDKEMNKEDRECKIHIKLARKFKDYLVQEEVFSALIKDQQAKLQIATEDIEKTSNSKLKKKGKKLFKNA